MLTNTAALGLGRERTGPMPQSLSDGNFLASGAATISLDDAANPGVKMGVAYWRSLCGQRRFPARSELTLRGMAPFLPNIVIIGVLGAGDDFEFRYVGEAQRQAFRTSFKGMRVSQIEAAVPRLGSLLRNAYEQARSLGQPFLVRGRVDHPPADSKLLYHETAFLPLGASEAAVDHLLIVGVQIPDPFWDISPAMLASLAGQSRVET